MSAMAMAAILAAAEVAMLPVREPAPASAVPAVRLAVEAVEIGDGSAVVEGGAEYAAGRTRLSLAARWQRTGLRSWPTVADVTIAADRQLTAREWIGVEVRRGLTRASGGLGLSITFLRRFR